MSRDPAEAATAERERLLAVYAARDEEQDPERYAPWNPAEALMRDGRRRVAAGLLYRAGVFPCAGDPCLEVGCGRLGWLADLLGWGLRESDLSGLDLDATRVAAAHAVFPTADLRVGDATQLPWPDGSFRMVVCSTVLSSILDMEVRRLVAAEIERALRPGGALLWYDFAFDNPRNPDVRRVTRREVWDLFPSLVGAIRRVTLAPPVARVVAPRSWLAAQALEAIPFMRTHLLAVLVKQAD